MLQFVQWTIDNCPLSTRGYMVPIEIIERESVNEYIRRNKIRF
jgi:hypothetical protein